MASEPPALPRSSVPGLAEVRRAAARRTRRMMVALIVGVAAALLAADWLSGGASRSWVYGSAELVVATEPAGASVTVDGVAQGSAPLSVKLEPGVRTLLIEHPHHPPYLEHLELARDTRIERSITLEPAFGTLLIASNPKGARVTLDGVVQPTVTPLELERIVAGMHQVELRIPGRTTQQLIAEVLPDGRAEVTAELERAPTGVLTVRVDPPDAQVVLVDEHGAEHRAGDPVPVGPYVLRVTRDGYRAEQRAVQVAPGTRIAQVALEQLRGSLELTVRPANARVTVRWGHGSGARTADYTPGMELPAGAVNIEARASGYRSGRRTVQIGDGPLAVALELRPIDARAGDRIQDPLDSGGMAPTLVVVPAGRFAPADATSRGRAVQAVTFETPFAIGVYEITRADWARYTSSEGDTMPAPRDGETDAHPVVRVSAERAVAYADWLSKQTGERYRLPTEAEWEYAARAGASGPYPNGTEVTGICTHANVADAALASRFREFEVIGCDDGQIRAAPVGQYQANPWGLYDVIGNVAEWTATCWNWAPGAGTSPDADCGARAVRGGSWNSAAAGVTLSAAEPISREGDDRGFRLLREL